MNVLRQLLDFTLPRDCPGCGGVHESSELFCGDCEREMVELEKRARCGYCAAPLVLAGSPCGHCLGNGFPLLDKVVSLGVLKEPLQTSIHRAKYEHRWPLIERLADRLLSREDVRAVLEHADVVVAVPLHRRRQRERGYNQAELMARRLVKGGSVKVIPAARRIRDTHTQAHLRSREQRAENLRDAFMMDNGEEIAAEIARKNVVLVDDVLTSGATLLSLARCLKRAEVVSFSAIVLAVADSKGRAFEVV